jgi:Zn-dependent protease
VTLGLFFENITRDPPYFVAVVTTVVVSIVLHELAHGFAALRQGDDTPLRLGHITWNPLVHMGLTALLFLVVAGIAWGQTPVSPARFKSRHGDAIVSFAGPATNLVLALIALTTLGLLVETPDDLADLYDDRSFGFLLFVFGYMNAVLFLFNLVPVPPLDGSRVLSSFVPSYRAWANEPNNQPFFLGALVLVMLVIGPVFSFVAEVAARYVLAI